MEYEPVPPFGLAVYTPVPVRPGRYFPHFLFFLYNVCERSHFGSSKEDGGESDVFVSLSSHPSLSRPRSPRPRPGPRPRHRPREFEERPNRSSR